MNSNDKHANLAGKSYSNGLTKGSMDTQIQHENVPSQGLRAIFWHANDFATAHEVAAGAWKTPPVIIWLVKIPSRMARCLYDQSQVLTFPLSCVHLVSTSGQWDAGIVTHTRTPTHSRTPHTITHSLTHCYTLLCQK